jgi:hypothetical protein
MITNVEKTYDIDGVTFNGYRMTKHNIISLVPLDEANTDYQAIQEWVAIEGNEIIDNGGGE